MITETARRLSTTERQIAGKARHVRDALGGITRQAGQAEPAFGRELAVLRHAPADLTLLLERHGLLAEQLAMILAAATQAAAGGTGARDSLTSHRSPGH
jgi:ABC-type transporter Mla subunit MlaD